MAKVLYADNDTDIVISPVLCRATGQVETGVVFSCTLYDPNDDPVSGGVGLLTSFEPATQCNTVTIPGSLGLTPGSGYSLNAAATGPYAGRINFQDVPVNVRSRNG